MAVEVRRAAERLKRVKHKLAATLVVVMALIAATAAVTGIGPAAQAANGPAWSIDTYGTPRATEQRRPQVERAAAQHHPGQPETDRPDGRLEGHRHPQHRHLRRLGALRPKGRRHPPARRVRRPAAEDTLANKNKAISYAAYRVLTDLFGDPKFQRRQDFPDRRPPTTSRCPTWATPSIPPRWTPPPRRASATCRPGGNRLPARRQSNQLGNDPQRHRRGTYSRHTGYQPANTWQPVTDPWNWQPLCVPLVPYGTPCASPSAVQKPYTPQWGRVTPFGLDPQSRMPYELESMPGLRKNADGSYDTTRHRPGPAGHLQPVPTPRRSRPSTGRTGPGTAFPPGHMVTFAEAFSRMSSDTLDQDAKLFFALGNGVMDAGIAAWNQKYLSNDTVRPITAIRERYRNQLINSWLGPGKGYGKVLGQHWMPYQATNVVTPAFPEYVSGHSTFTAAGRTILALFYGTDNFNAKVTIPAGSSSFESGHPGQAGGAVVEDADRRGRPGGHVAPLWRHPLPDRRYGRPRARQGRRLRRLEQGADLHQRDRHRPRVAVTRPSCPQPEPPGLAGGPGGLVFGGMERGTTRLTIRDRRQRRTPHVESFSGS